jgi:uncharacterized membrane protein
MIYLIAGVALWWAAHLLKRLAPGLREDLDKALGRGAPRGLIALAILASVVLMVVGYRSAGWISVYTPVPHMGWATGILMAVAIFMMGIGPAGGQLYAKYRHPMLWGFFLWAVAHLLVNGDLASIILFGGLGLWAPLQVRLINAHEGPWERPKPGNALQDWKLLLATLFLFCLIAMIHWLFDRNPFLGTYP